MKLAAALAIAASVLAAPATVRNPSLKLRDIDGVVREPMKAAPGQVQALFFITDECPVANYYAREIRRICEVYAHRGLGCSLVYVDPATTDEGARKHAAEYGHGAYPKLVDRDHSLVNVLKPQITPTAVVIRSDATIAYKGRIDNSFAAVGVPRRVVTEHDLRGALDAVFAGRSVAKAEAPVIGCYIDDLRPKHPNASGR